jgi:hypothetical protein
VNHLLATLPLSWNSMITVDTCGFLSWNLLLEKALIRMERFATFRLQYYLRSDENETTMWTKRGVLGKTYHWSFRLQKKEERKSLFQS